MRSHGYGLIGAHSDAAPGLRQWPRATQIPEPCTKWSTAPEPWLCAVTVWSDTGDGARVAVAAGIGHGAGGTGPGRQTARPRLTCWSALAHGSEPWLCAVTVTVWSVPTRLRPLASGMVQVASHVLGDVPSPPLVGLLQGDCPPICFVSVSFKGAEGPVPPRAVRQSRRALHAEGAPSAACSGRTGARH